MDEVEVSEEEEFHAREVKPLTFFGPGDNSYERAVDYRPQFLPVDENFQYDANRKDVVAAPVEDEDWTEILQNKDKKDPAPKNLLDRRKEQ